MEMKNNTCRRGEEDEGKRFNCMHRRVVLNAIVLNIQIYH